MCVYVCGEGEMEECCIHLQYTLLGINRIDIANRVYIAVNEINPNKNASRYPFRTIKSIPAKLQQNQTKNTNYEC